MTKSEQERVIIWRRMIKDKEFFKDINDLQDEDLLVILNSTVLPNSISLSNMKYTLFFSFLYRKKETVSFIKILTRLWETFTPSEKDLSKFGLMYGFDSYEWRYQIGRYVKTSSNIEKGDLFYPKEISANTFKQIFDFIYKIIYKGEKNERFPRI